MSSATMNAANIASTARMACVSTATFDSYEQIFNLMAPLSKVARNG